MGSMEQGKEDKEKDHKRNCPKKPEPCIYQRSTSPHFFFNKAKNPWGVVRKRVLCPYLSSWYHCKHLVELDDETLIKPSKGLLLGAAPPALTTGGVGPTTQENLGGHTSARDNPRPRMVTKTERGCDCVREHKEDLAHWKLHMLARPAADLHMVLYHSSPYIKMLWWQQMTCHIFSPPVSCNKVTQSHPLLEKPASQCLRNSCYVGSCAIRVWEEF